MGIVFSEHVDSFRQEGPAWDLVSFANPVPFGVDSVARLSALCEWPRSFLVVVPVADALAIVGIATPHSRGFLDRDALVRVLTPKPGVVIVCRGNNEVVRYERGAISPRAPSPRAPFAASPFADSGSHRPQLDSIEQTIMGPHAEDEGFDARRFLLRIVRDMVSLGHGGLLAILAPDENPGPLLVDAKRLAPPLKCGQAISEMYDAEFVVRANAHTRFAEGGGAHDMRPETLEEERDSALALAASQRVSRLIPQIARLTAVDGAVVMSHGFDVLAFGAKLPTPKDARPDVVTVSSARELDIPWDLSSRGTRHRAAAVFANGHPMRLSVIVSQDGHAATFQQLDSKLVYWPLGITVAAQEDW